MKLIFKSWVISVRKSEYKNKIMNQSTRQRVICPVLIRKGVNKFMKIELQSEKCTIIFESKDKFAGKKLKLEGDIENSNKFIFNSQRMKWITKNEEGRQLLYFYQ